MQQLGDLLSILNLLLGASYNLPEGGNIYRDLPNFPMVPQMRTMTFVFILKELRNVIILRGVQMVER